MKPVKPMPAVKKNPSLLDREIKTLSPRRRRVKAYYAGKRIIQEGYQVNHSKRWFQTGFSSLNEIPEPGRYYARQLLRLGYTHQLKLI